MTLEIFMIILLLVAVAVVSVVVMFIVAHVLCERHRSRV